MNLFPLPTPPMVDGVEILLGDAAEAIQALSRRGVKARLIMADPPWRYRENPGKSSNPEEQGIYSGLSYAEITSHLRLTADLATPDARLALWITFPILAELLSDPAQGVIYRDAIKWKPISGGAWVKTSDSRGSPNLGVGSHWLGAAETLLLYRRSGARQITNRAETLTNGCTDVIGRHSEKPVTWLVSMLLRWTEPGDTVVDLYSGRAPLARACYETRRRYFGIEVSEDRRRQALDSLAAYASRHPRLV